MSRSAQHRDKLIQTAIRLFRQQGYTGTGIAEVLKYSGAPKGSLYHYFPGGKTEIGQTALEVAGQQVSTTLQKLQYRTPNGPTFLQAYIKEIKHWLVASGYKDGCPLATTLLETLPGSAQFQSIGVAVINNWITLIGDAYERDGIDKTTARTHGLFVFSAIQGALIV